MARVGPSYQETPTLTTGSPAEGATPQYPNLNQLWPPGGSDEGVEVEVIAVHGLDANPQTTWTKGGINWLNNAQFLPSLIPNARIWTFDFESQWLGLEKPIQQLQSLGGKLLEFMKLRLTAPHRPIVFIAHSFGGIVVIKALVMAVSRKDYGPLLDLTTGGIFLGTPFRGSGVIELAQMIVSVAKAFGVQGTKALLNHLHPEDEMLRELVDDFSRLAKDKSLDLLFFYELLAQPLIKKRIKGIRSLSRKFDKIIVPPESAHIPGFEKSGLNTIHTHMNEFDDVDDPNYQLVSAHVQGVVKRAPGTLARRSKVTRAVQYMSMPHSRLRTFVGREDLLCQIEDKMAWDDDKYQARVALCGQAGVGKTQLAIEYAFRTTENHAMSGIYWVSGASIEKFKESYLRIGQKAKITTNNSKESLRKIMEWLEDDQNGRWLMIIDNIDDLDLLQENTPEGQCDKPDNDSDCSLLSKYIPSCSHGSILYTSRDRNLCIDVAGPKSWVQVDQMSTNDCQQLIENSLQEYQYQAGGIDDLISILEGLPLALAQAISFIEKNRISVIEYLTLFKEGDLSRIRLLSEVSGCHATQIISEPAVTTWIISFNQIKRKQPLAAKLLGFMSIVDRYCIPAEVVPLPQDVRERFDDPKTHGVAAIEICEAYGILEGFSMITACGGTGFSSACWYMHALVQSTMRRWMRENGEYYYHLTTVLHELVYWFTSAPEPTLYGPCLPCAFTVLVLLTNMENSSSNMKALTQTDDNELTNGILTQQSQQLKATDAQAELLLRKEIAAYYRETSQFWDAELWLDEALKKSRETFGNTDKITLELMSQLGSIYIYQYRADDGLWLQLEVLEGLKERCQDLDLTDNFVANTYSYLAIAYNAVGKYTESEDIWNKLVKSAKSKTQGDSAELFYYQANLARCYLDSGRLNESERLFSDTIEQWKIAAPFLNPPESQVSLKFGIDRADCLLAQNRVDEACEEYDRLGMRSIENLGDNHPITIQALCGLASILQQKGELGIAEDFWDLIAQKTTIVYGKLHIKTLEAQLKLASVMEKQNEWKKAANTKKKVVKRGKDVLAPELFESTIYSLAKLLVKAWEPDTARATMRQYIEMISDRLGKDDPQVLAAIEELSGWTNLPSHFGLDEEAYRVLYLMHKVCCT